MRLTMCREQTTHSRVHPDAIDFVESMETVRQLGLDRLVVTHPPLEPDLCQEPSRE
jgi:hypothetical protein